MTEFRIRPAAADEREGLEALQLRSSLANPGDRQALLDNPDAITLPVDQIDAGLVIVAEADNAILGFAALLPRPDGQLELDGLFVEPSLWRGGVGRALVERCCEMSRQMMADHLHVLGNPHALDFYHRCGFETLGVEATRFGSGVTMRKTLLPPAL